MPSSRNARRLLTQTGQANLHELRQLAEMGADVPLHDHAVSPEQRAAFRARRDRLRREFAALPPHHRKRRAREYMAELIEVSLSRRSFWGAWTLHFEPLIEDDDY